MKSFSETRKPHPFPAVEQWLDELESAEKAFREVLNLLVANSSDAEARFVAREVLAKHPKDGK